MGCASAIPLLDVAVTLMIHRVFVRGLRIGHRSQACYDSSCRDDLKVNCTLDFQCFVALRMTGLSSLSCTECYCRLTMNQAALVLVHARRRPLQSTCLSALEDLTTLGGFHIFATLESLADDENI